MHELEGEECIAAQALQASQMWIALAAAGSKVGR